jgi:hypothetical protein
LVSQEEHCSWGKSVNVKGVNFESHVLLKHHEHSGSANLSAWTQNCIITIIIIIISISFMQGIYTYIPETNHVPRKHCVATILM